MDYTLQNRSALLSDIDKDNNKDNEKSKFLKSTMYNNASYESNRALSFTDET